MRVFLAAFLGIVISSGSFGQAVTPFSGLTRQSLVVPSTRFFFAMPADHGGLTVLDEIGRAYGDQATNAIIIFEQRAQRDGRSRILNLLDSVDSTRVKLVLEQELNHDGWTGNFQKNDFLVDGNPHRSWSMLLESGEEYAAAIAICPDTFLVQYERIFDSMFASIRFATRDTLDPFTGWPAAVDPAEFGYRKGESFMPGALTFVPEDQAEEGFPEVSFSFMPLHAPEIEEMKSTLDTLSDSETRNVIRGDGFMQLLEWDRDQRGSIDNLQLTVVIFCGDRQMMGFGHAPYTDERLAEFKRIAKAMRCQ